MKAYIFLLLLGTVVWGLNSLLAGYDGDYSITSQVFKWLPLSGLRSHSIQNTVLRPQAM